MRACQILAVMWLAWCAAGVVQTCHALAQDKGNSGAVRGTRILLDMSKKETFVLLPVNGDPQDVRVTDVKVSGLPTSYQLVPTTGTARLGHPIDIQLEKPENVRIRLAVVKRGKAVALKISPQVELGPNNAIDLTQDRLMRTVRNFQRRVRDLNRRLTTLSRERQSLNIWLLTPGNKPLKAVKATHLRMKLLDQAIRARQRDVPITQNYCVTLHHVANFISKLHKKVEIRYSVEVRSQPEER